MYNLYIMYNINIMYFRKNIANIMHIHSLPNLCTNRLGHACAPIVRLGINTRELIRLGVGIRVIRRYIYIYIYIYINQSYVRQR